jgi:hypothetical protein
VFSIAAVEARRCAAGERMAIDLALLRAFENATNVPAMPPS